MTLKNYRKIKIATTFILAIVFSQLIYLKNWFYPVALMIVASLLMMYMRKQVTDVVADERDYATAGKAAVLTIQIFGWCSAIGAFVLMSARSANPIYGSVASVLAYSTCILMFLYTLIYRYYNKFKFSDWKLIYSFVLLILFVVMTIFTIRFMSGEDGWRCVDGQWVKHGHPSFNAPMTECKK